MDDRSNAAPTIPRARPTLDERIAQQRARLEKLENKRKAAERRAAKADREAERSAENRRKILAGAFVLDQLGGDPARAARLRIGDGPTLEKWLTRPIDRAAFGLAPLAEPQPMQGWDKTDAAPNGVGRPADPL